MKKLLLLTSVFVALSMYAQDDMTTVWESKLDHQIESHGTGNETRGFSYAASAKEVTVFDNKTGKVIWTKRFKDIAPKIGLLHLEEIIGRQ